MFDCLGFPEQFSQAMGTITSFFCIFGVIVNPKRRIRHIQREYRRPDFSANGSMRHKIVSRCIDMLYEHADQMDWLNQYRFERREGILAVLSSLVSRMEIWTQAIGLPTAEGWMAYGWHKVMDQFNIGERRMYRIIDDLTKEKLIESNQRLHHPAYITKDDGTPSGYAISDKRISYRFFKMLAEVSGKPSLLKHLARAQEKAAQKLNKQAAELKTTVEALFTRTVAKFKTAIGQFLSQCVEEKKTAQQNKPAELKRDINAFTRADEMTFTNIIYQRFKNTNNKNRVEEIATSVYTRFGKIRDVLINPNFYIDQVLL